jgi:hypothetical protein
VGHAVGVKRLLAGTVVAVLALAANGCASASSSAARKSLRPACAYVTRAYMQRFMALPTRDRASRSARQNCVYGDAQPGDTNRVVGVRVLRGTGPLPATVTLSTAPLSGFPAGTRWYVDDVPAESHASLLVRTSHGQVSVGVSGARDNLAVAKQVARHVVAQL